MRKNQTPAMPSPARESVVASVTALILVGLTAISANAGGDFDTTFGDAGIVITPFRASAPNGARSVIVQPDGKLVVGGTALSRFTPLGEPDTAFGVGGSTDVDYRMQALALQNDGKIVAVGQSVSVLTNADVVLQRFNIDGSVDTTFGDQGRTVIDVNGRSDLMKGLVIRPNGNIIAGGCSITDLNQNTVAIGFTGDGRLDSSFGSGGVVQVEVSSPAFDDCANAIKLQDDGKVILGGFAEMDIDQGNCGTEDFALLRLNSNGSLDSSFGAGGVVTTDLGCEEVVSDFMINADGSITIAGTAETDFNEDGFPDNFGDTDWYFARYTSSGELDTGFGTEGTGLVHVEVGIEESENINAILPLPGGAFYTVGGLRRDGTGEDLVVARLSESGALDSSFGTQGIVKEDVGSNSDFVFDAALTVSELPVVLGTTRGQGGSDIFAVLLDSDGELDSGFADDGLLIADLEEVVTAQVRAVALNGGNILVAGYSGSFSTADMLLTKFSDAGVQDLSFGTDGWAVADFDEDEDEARDVLIQVDGKIVIGGKTNVDGSDRFALMRYLASGVIDTGFNGDGRVVIEFPQGRSEAEAIALQADGKIVIGGFVVDPTTSFDFALARVNADGSLDTSFGSDGVVSLDLAGGVDTIGEILLQPDGKIIAVGSARNVSTLADFALARFTAEGDLDATFGDAGVVIFDFFSRPDSALSVVLSATGEIFAAGTADRGSIAAVDFAVASFDTNGVFQSSNTLDVNENRDIARAIDLDSDGRVVTAGVSGVDTGVARFLPDLTIDTTFGADGTVFSDFGTSNDEAFDMVIDSQDRILVAGETVQLDDAFPRAFVLQRFLSEPSDVIFIDGFE